MIKHLYLFILFYLNPLLSPPEGFFTSNTFEGSGGCLIETGGLFNLAKKRRYHFSLKNQLEWKVETLQHKKLEVMKLMIKKKSELPAVEYTIQDQRTRSFTVTIDP